MTIPVPPVVLRRAGAGNILGRVARTAAPRPGELVNLPEPGFGEGRLMFRARRRERWHTASSAPRPGRQFDTLGSGDIVVMLELVSGEEAIRPPRLGAFYALNGQVLGTLVRTTEADGADHVTLEIGGRRRLFKVADVERCFDDMAMHPDAACAVFQQTDVICHLTELEL